MKNWKTTALGMIFPLFGIPAEAGNAVSTLGLFAKDSNVTGGSVSQ